MPLYREEGPSGLIVEDPWLRLADDAAVPAEGMVLVSFARWREARAALLARRGQVGVALANTDSVEALASDVARFDLVVLHFPKFSDGRAYSQARLLRGRFAYQGELRASGGVLQDQIAFMLVDDSGVSRDYSGRVVGDRIEGSNGWTAVRAGK